MMNLREILNECVAKDNFLKFESFVFGSDDFLASIGKFFILTAVELCSVNPAKFDFSKI